MEEQTVRLLWKAFAVVWCVSSACFEQSRLRRLGFVMISLAAVSNGAAVFFNDMRMPAMAAPPGFRSERHVAWEDPNLPWLCDWISGQMSPGDVLLISGLVFTFVLPIALAVLRRTSPQLERA